MKTIIEMAREAGVRDDGHRFEFSEYKYLERFAELVLAEAQAEERKVCEGMKTYIDRHNAVIQSSAADCAAAIRARGNT